MAFIMNRLVVLIVLRQDMAINVYLSKTSQEPLKEFNGHYKEIQLNFCIFPEKQKDKGIVKPTKTTLEVKF